ncbi:Na+/H+ antiporter NhaC family protein [uncultured Shewanella sp.]|uniref:Na+/H+ antiporter NhaC family protein n=1 Tax=uncultured Shewanella sp. TaxID=173975 RepID=UPI0026088542|nr:Na+/H+ antiporter NhaC family protein [uncultured Shewanella sp.]
MNAVIISVLLLVGLTLCRLNILSAIIVSCFMGGWIAGLSVSAIWQAFQSGLGHASPLALSYAIIGGFSYLIASFGLTDIVSGRLSTMMNNQTSQLKLIIIITLTSLAIFSQNLIPVHVAFIPLLIPPMLLIFSRLQLDRRLIACLLSFGLVTPYMFLPLGFGQLFLNELIRPQVALQGVSGVDNINMMRVMLLPAVGMLVGVSIAVLFSYNAPRQYHIQTSHTDTSPKTLSNKNSAIIIIALLSFFVVQLMTDSMAIAALVGCGLLGIGKRAHWGKSNSLFLEGTRLMASIGVIMMAAAGFAEVMKLTGHIQSLIDVSVVAFQERAMLSVFIMLLVGLLITIGIGSSFATVPLLATIYVPIGQAIGLSLEAIICLLVSAAVLGDTGSPVSEVTLATSAGLNHDGQHDHLKDTVIPTFIHFNLPLLAFSSLAIYLL